MAKKQCLSDCIIKYSSQFITGLLCLIFLYFSIASLLATSVLDPNHFLEEHILFARDNVLINLLMIAAIIVTLKLLQRYAGLLNPKLAAISLIIFTTIIGAIWIVSVKSVPAADSGSIVKSALAFINGSYAPLQSSDSYFRYYPFQLGFTFICELLMRVFGSGSYVALAMVNLVFLVIAYIALILISRLVFHNKEIELLIMVLLACCWQPILFCTLIYGNIIGWAFSMWAVCLEIIYMQTGKKYMLVLAGLFIAVAAAAKPNYLIVLAAMCIILLLHFLQTRQWFNLLSIIFISALTLGCSNLIILSYESRSNTDLGSGAPQLLWVAMGLQESPRAEGWYNGYSLDAFRDNNYNADTSAEQARTDIAQRLAIFSNNPRYALTFFNNKVLSQWNEVTYESIWVSQIKKHVSPVPAFVQSVYNGQAGNFLHYYFNFHQQLIMVGFFASMLYSLRKADLCFAFLPLIILGGFLYHFISEAKSQYVLIYFIMLIPYSAHGLHAIINGNKTFNNKK